MPALVLFGRRWQLGSDDFVLSSSIDLIISLAWLVASVGIYWKNEEGIANCPGSGGFFTKFYYFGFFAISHVIILLDALIIQNSRRGGIMDIEARKYVPFVLYFRIFAGLGSIGWNILGVVWIFMDQFTCGETEEPILYVECLIIFNAVTLIFQLLFLIYCYDPLGASTNQFLPLDSDNEFQLFNLNIPVAKTKYTSRWEKRCWRYYCCFFNCSRAEETQEAFREVGRIFGSELADNLVDSDVVAGLLLLNLKEKKDRQSLKTVKVVNNIEFNSTCSPRVVTGEPSVLSFKSSAISSPNTLTPLNFELAMAEEWRSSRFLFQFVKYACAAYGWILVPPKRLWRSCICCSCVPKRNYRYSEKVKGDNCCLCWTSGVKDLNRIEFEDIAHVTFQNKLFQSPFFVAVDHKTNSIVISIRGTLSFHDVVVDLAGWPAEIPGYPPTFKAHHGMLKASLNLKRKLDELQVIERLMEAHPTYNLVITGQSLGAGLATILSLLMRLEHPYLKCYAYSPPGGLLSGVAADFCNDFLVSVIYGDDFVSRLGLLQFERLKFRILEVLKNCKVPKYRILLRGFFCCQEIQPSYIGNNSLTLSPDQNSGEIENPVPIVTENGANSAQDSEDKDDRDFGDGTSADADADSQSTASTATAILSSFNDEKPKYSQAIPQTRYPMVDGMYPPGKIFYITEVPKSERKICQSKWAWRWADRTEFDEIIVSSKMLWDHIPIKMPKSLRYLAKSDRLNNTRNF